jgi:uncharacterized protein (DUF302 family)
MKYYKSVILEGHFEELMDKVTALLKDEGFGIITQIDVAETMKKKLDVDFKKYMILGACNPHIALRAFQAEDKIGALLPCNVLVIDQGKNQIEIAFVDAEALMNHLGNPQLDVLAREVRNRLDGVMNKLLEK